MPKPVHSKPIMIDIRTKFITEELKAYILFPGSSYRFHEYMQDNKVVFLDIPGFKISADEDLSLATDLVARLTLSDRIRGWHAGGRPSDDLPSRAVDQLGAYRSTPAKQQLAGLIRNFYTGVKTGDIVVVPCQNMDSEVLFGEVASEEITEVSIAEYGDDTVPALSIEWIAKVART